MVTDINLHQRSHKNTVYSRQGDWEIPVLKKSLFILEGEMFLLIKKGKYQIEVKCSIFTIKNPPGPCYQILE